MARMQGGHDMRIRLNFSNGETKEITYTGTVDTLALAVFAKEAEQQCNSIDFLSDAPTNKNFGCTWKTTQLFRASGADEKNNDIYYDIRCHKVCILKAEKYNGPAEMICGFMHFPEK